MTDVFTLLSLPTTSNAFTAYQPSSQLGLMLDELASPRRKTARLELDSDAPSSSRYRRQGPFRITVIGDEGNAMQFAHLPDRLISVLTVKRPQDSSEPFRLLRHSIRTILTRGSEQSLGASFQTLYSACRAVVTVHNDGEELYNVVKMELEQSLIRLATAMETFKAQGPEASEAPGMKWIEEFVKTCQWFEETLSLLQSILTYLDQIYVMTQRELQNTRDLAYSLFTQRIFENFAIARFLRAGISEWVEFERKLRLTHDLRPQIQLLISHLISHEQYPVFEDYYAQITSEFYSQESSELAELMKDDPRRFFQHAYQRIEEENKRSQDVLPIGSWSLVRETTERAIWIGRLPWLAKETVGPYLLGKDFVTLAKMYMLFARVDGVTVLLAAFRDFIQRSVRDIVNDEANDDIMVQRLLDMKLLADTVVNTAFVNERIGVTTSSTDKNHSGRILRTTATTNSAKPQTASTSAPPAKYPNPDFVYAVTGAFALGFKTRRNRPAEMIAKHLDKAMRRGQGSISDAEYEALLDSMLALYRFTDDKDVFRKFYHRSLAKRLLLEKSASNDFEATMLKKLKENYDPEFGMGEEMFKDLALSKEMMRDYHSRLNSQSPGHKLMVMVLQRSAWPFTVQKSTILVPPDMQIELAAFAKYYKQWHSGHMLDWDHALGTVVMKARFGPGSKELSLSLYQAAVLLLFNESTDWKYADILERTQIEGDELKRTLQSLACGKKRVLRKLPPGKEVDVGDSFRFNNDFQDEKTKVHINSIQAKVSPEESQRTNQSVEGDRKHYLDAAIVRIMKAKKELTYEQLKTATIDAVSKHFRPEVDAIKKRIDALVETDYLERSKEDKTKFLYVA